MHKAHLPLNALRDTSLSGADIKVLAAICTHYGEKGARKTHPTRKDIGLMAAVGERQVSASTALLVQRGWLVKSGKGGRSGPAVYSVNWTNNPEQMSRVIYKNPAHQFMVNESLIPAQMFRVSGDENPEHLCIPVRMCMVSELNPAHPFRHISLREEEEITNHHSSESESVHAHALPHFAFGDALRVLIDHGMPEVFVNNDLDRRTVLGWIGRFTREEVTEACRRGKASKEKRGDLNPIGIRYINTILEQAREAVVRNSGQGSAGHRVDDTAADWLAEQEVRRAEG